MSTNTVSSSSSATTLQNIARTIMDEFDANKDGQFAFDEFANFLDSFVESVAGKQTATETGATTASSTATATSLFLTTTSAATASATASTTAFRERMLGFDYSRFDSAKGSLKYDAANIMQGIDPSQAGAMKQAYDQLVKLHPGEVSMDKDGNLMLDGTADGYIGVRPLNRNENWDSAPSGYAWQWMAYNDAHPGPNGETA